MPSVKTSRKISLVLGAVVLGLLAVIAACVKY